MKIKENAWIAYLLIALAITVGSYIRISNVNISETDTTIRTPDEAMYTAYASVIAHEGPSGVAIAVREYNKNQKLWLLPPPTRVSYLFLLAKIMKMLDRYDLSVGIFLSCAVSILTLLLVAAFCLRFFDPWIAMYTCIFMAASPMELILAGKVWQDGLMTLLGGALVFIACEAARAKKRSGILTVFCLMGAITILMKESGILIFMLCEVFLVFWLIRQKAWAAVCYLVGMSLLAVGVSVFTLINLSGGWEPVHQLYNHLRQTVPLNEYASQMQNGPWHSNLGGFFMLSPATAILCAGGIWLVLTRPRAQRSEVLLFSAVLFISFVALGSWPAYFKNLRYLSPVYVPFYMLAGYAFSLGAENLQKILKKPIFTRMVTIILIVVLAGLDIWNFQTIFIQGHTKDLVNPLLRDHTIYLNTSN